MALPSTGYAKQFFPAPSDDTTDFSLLVDFSLQHADWWSENDTSDGAKGRAAKDADETELATDPIEFDNVAETGHARILWSGTVSPLSSDAARTIRIYPPVAANSSYAAGDTYGQHAAYDSDTVGYWPLHDANDRTSNANHGTASGGVTVGGATGQVGAATDFDGSNDYVGAGTIDVTGFSEVSWSVWIKSNGNSERPFSLRHSGNDDIRIWSDDSGSNSHVAIDDGTAYEAKLGTIADGAWHYIVGTFDGSTIRAYRDGNLINSTGSASFNFSTANGKTRIGASANDGAYFDGLIDETRIDSSFRSAAWISQEYAQTSDQATFWGTWTWESGGATVTLTAESGSLNFAGTDANLLYSRVLAAEPGSLSLDGQDAALTVGKAIDAESGSLSLDGQDVSLLHNRSLPAESEALELAGQDASLLVSRRLDAESGSLNLAGQDATLSTAADKTLVAEAGSLNLDGTDASLIHDRLLSADSGSLEFSGKDASLLHNRSLNAEPGSLNLAGQDATLTTAADRTITAESGSLSLAGTDADLLHARRVSAESGSLDISGQDAALKFARVLEANAGSLNLAATDSALRFGRLISAEPGSLSLNGFDATLTRTTTVRTLAAEPGSLLLTGTDATLIYTSGQAQYFAGRLSAGGYSVLKLT